MNYSPGLTILIVGFIMFATMFGGSSNKNMKELEKAVNINGAFLTAIIGTVVLIFGSLFILGFVMIKKVHFFFKRILA